MISCYFKKKYLEKSGKNKKKSALIRRWSLIKDIFVYLSLYQIMNIAQKIFFIVENNILIRKG